MTTRRPGTRLGTRTSGLLLAALLTVLSPLVGATAAVAAPAGTGSPSSSPGVRPLNGWGYVTEGNLRRDPNLNAQKIVTIYNAWVDIVCWIDGGPNGFGSNRWFRANYYANVGYLSSGVVSSQPSVGHC